MVFSFLLLVQRLCATEDSLNQGLCPELPGSVRRQHLCVLTETEPFLDHFRTMCAQSLVPESRKGKRPFPPTARAHPGVHPARLEATSRPFSHSRGRLAGRSPPAMTSHRLRSSAASVTPS